MTIGRRLEQHVDQTTPVRSYGPVFSMRLLLVLKEAVAALVDLCGYFAVRILKKPGSWARTHEHVSLATKSERPALLARRRQFVGDRVVAVAHGVSLGVNASTLSQRWPCRTSPGAMTANRVLETGQGIATRGQVTGIYLFQGVDAPETPTLGEWLSANP